MNRVTGVAISKDGQTFQVGANKEVIVSAGAIESPKILMLSGIGPRDHLQKLGVRIALISASNNVKDACVACPFYFLIRQNYECRINFEINCYPTRTPL